MLEKGGFWGALLVSAAVFGSAAAASEDYDNPGLGDTPCLILKSYQASSTGETQFGAAASVENVCGRSVEVDFCFPFVTAEDAIEPHCENGVVRPWATAEIAVNDLPSRLAGPDYRWRYLP